MNNPLKFSDPTGYSVYHDPWTEYEHKTIEEMNKERFGDTWDDIEHQREIDNQSKGGQDYKIVLISIPGIPGLVPIIVSNKKNNQDSSDFNIKLTLGVQAGSNLGGIGGTFGLFGNLCSITLIGYENNKLIYPSSQNGYSQMNQGISGGFVVGGEINHTFDASFNGYGYRNDSYNVKGGIEAGPIGTNIEIGSNGIVYNVLDVSYNIGVIIGFEINFRIKIPLK